MSSLPRVLAFARVAHSRFALAVLTGALALGAAVGLMATSAWLISRAAEHPPILTLTVAIAAVRALSLGRGVLRYAERLAGHSAALDVLRKLRVAVWKRLEVIAPASLPEYRSGDLLARLVADVDAVADVFLRVLIPAAVAALACAGTVALLYWLLPSAGLALLVTMLFAAVAVPWLTARVGQRAERQLAPLRGRLFALTVELIQGAPDLIAFGAARHRLSLLADLDRELANAQACSARTSGLGAGLTALAAGFAGWAALALGASAVHSGALSGVTLAVIVLIPVAAFEAVTILPPAAQHLQRGRRSAARVTDVLDRAGPVREPAVPAALPPGPYTVRVVGLGAHWPGTGTLALNGVDLELGPGQRVAVVGPSGSGKTTLASVLVRFLDPSAGVVTLNGVDITTLAGDDVRRVVKLCAQDGHLFDTTVEENVRLARRSATPEALRAALAKVRLLEWVDSLPQGVQTPVGEHGAQVSGGQRQRIALARALLADSPVLLLDEPAEHLDLPTADALTVDLLAATAGHTTLFVTHRLTGLEAVDEVVVLHAGQVIQRGSHAALIAQDGLYRRMWDREREALDLGGATQSRRPVN
jgi:thiol reductant ABC exporter CydC subunit